jgi:urease accessory protein
VPRTQKVLRSGDRGPGEIIDTLLLKFEDRVKQQGFVFGGKGTCIEFDFPDPLLLRTDDLLVLDDGGLVEVVADVEQVLEVREKDFVKAARLLLALGNRHVSVQILANRLRMLPNPETALLLRQRGFKPEMVTAPFEPEDDGAHGHDHAGHHIHDHGHHGHDHAHDHGHEHHEHGHGHAHDDSHAHDHHHGHRHGKT